jgi:tRNA (guanine-N7-)-methyltransferase
MRQHVNPLNKNFQIIENIPPLNEIFEDPSLPLHLDIGSASGDFLFELAAENHEWNYFGIEIRERLVINARSRMREKRIDNLYFAFGNANNIFDDLSHKFLIKKLSSVSFNFPDPWFKKKHYKRRVIQPDLIAVLSESMKKESLIYIKTDVRELFDYMDSTILNNLNFRKLESSNLNSYKTFNPKNIQTSREKYVINNRLNIFERVYVKI